MRYARVILSVTVKRCHICGKPASIFLTKISDGKLTDLALCKKCAQEKGIFDPRKLTLAEQVFPSELSGEVEAFIKKMIEASFMDEAADDLSALPDMLTECPHCHYSLEQFRQTGYLGCPECYKIFSTELANTVFADESEPQDAPHKSSSNAEYLLGTPAMERERLELLMRDAVHKENYEEAARLRDLIKNLPSS